MDRWIERQVRSTPILHTLHDLLLLLWMDGKSYCVNRDESPRVGTVPPVMDWEAHQLAAYYCILLLNNYSTASDLSFIVVVFYCVFIVFFTAHSFVWLTARGDRFRREFSLRATQDVLHSNSNSNRNRVVPGIVTEVAGPVSYKCQVENENTVQKHVDQIHKREVYREQAESWTRPIDIP